jgi:hypothetical protein
VTLPLLTTLLTIPRGVQNAEKDALNPPCSGFGNGRLCSNDQRFRLDIMEDRLLSRRWRDSSFLPIAAARDRIGTHTSRET